MNVAWPIFKAKEDLKFIFIDAGRIRGQNTLNQVAAFS